MLDMQTSQNLIHKETTHVNKIVIALMIAVVAAGPAVASEETEVMAAVNQFVDVSTRVT